jgi:hypothetical protein
MNHIAFKVPADKFDAYLSRLAEKGVKTSRVMNHDDSPTQMSETVSETTYVRSVYFFDPDGALLEFACWTRELDESDVSESHLTAFGLRKQPGPNTALS